MPMWRCPHCNTPQAETARCWVCRRSSTACATCRHFRSSVAGSIGYCGLDPRRAPLAGDEIRACWESRSVTSELVAVGPGQTAAAAAPPRLSLDDHGNRREFVEVGGRSDDRPPGTTHPIDEADAAAPSPPTVGPRRSPPEPAWDLWGDLDP